MLIKQEYLSQKLNSRDFWRIAYSVVHKGKSVMPLFNGPSDLLQQLE